MENSTRNHLFINYAKEDIELARWLTLKLTNEGYYVWCDEFKQLGGESYPRDIDNAIKNQTFRFIALLSKSSIQKENPLKERTLAHNLAKERKEDFVIPLNVDGLSQTELDWMDSDITYIPFYHGWAPGLEQLLKKLKSIDTPRAPHDGKSITANEYLQISFSNQKAETLYTNQIPFLKIPSQIKQFNLKRMNENEKEILSEKWAFFIVDNETLLAFSSPPSSISQIFDIRLVNQTDWKRVSRINNIDVNNIVSNLLLKSIYVLCYQKGLKKIEREISAKRGKLKVAYFPAGLLEKDKIVFMGYGDKSSRVNVFGERNRWIGPNQKEKYRFHLSPSFQIRRASLDNYVALLNVRLHITDESAQPLKQRAANARRKNICKDWWNHEWLNRYLAILSFLADAKDRITIGENEEEQVVLSTKFIEVNAPYGLDEELIEKARNEFSTLISEEANQDSDEEADDT